MTCDALYHQCPGPFCASNLDPNNCGSTCGSNCPAPGGSGTGVPSCNGTSCTVTCTNGSGQCTVSGVAGCYNLSSDNANCGACGHACKTPIGGVGTCSQGMCTGTKIASVASYVSDVASDGTNLYWVDPGAQAVYQAPILSAGSAFTLAIQSGGNNFYARGIDVTSWNGASLIAFTRYNSSAFQSEVWNATPSHAATLATVLSTTTDSPFGIAFNPGAASPSAWVETGYSTTFQMYDGICTSSTTCASANGWTQISEGNQLTGTPGFKVVWGAAAGVWAPFWLMKSSGVLYGNTIAIETGETNPDSLATDGTDLYWVTSDTVNSSRDGNRAPRDPEPEQRRPVPRSDPRSLDRQHLDGRPEQRARRLASDGKYVYFTGTTSAGAGIYYVPVGGGTVQELVPVGQPSLVMVAKTASGPLIVYADVKAAQGALYEVPPAP